MGNLKRGCCQTLCVSWFVALNITEISFPFLEQVKLIP